MNWTAAVLLSVALAIRALAASPSTSTECLTCHDQQGTTFKTSAHGGLGCTDCHSNFRAYPHAENAPRVKCDTCHADSVTKLKGSAHASVSAEPCLGCHGDAHGILPASNPKSAVYPQNLPRTCGTCHGDSKMAKKHGITEVYSLYVDSIHGSALTKDGLLVAASCSSCHGSHQILSSKNAKSRTAHGNIPATCGTCHAGPKEAYLKGVHGKNMEAGNTGTPVCTDCHNAHQISRVETAAFQKNTTGTCGGCHSEQLTTYRDTFHAQVSALGYVETAHCWDCHEAHEVLPGSNPKSTVAKANLTKTCGKCHAGATASFISYQPHADSHNGDTYPMLHYSAIFMNLLLSGVLGFFTLHMILWFLRSRFDGGKHGPEAPSPGQK